MSQQLLLVEFPSDESGKIYEPETNTILTASVNNALVEYLSKEDLFEETSLYEDSSFEEYTTILRLKEDQIGNALDCITAMLTQLLETERVEKIKALQTEADISNLMSEFQVISSSYQLIKLKRDNFATSISTIVMLG
ncbi:hypothetical protein LOY35_27495 [Pseudomonas sp. B21-028]|uniref:hypothetical protein n=1 Tax=Pseudomonas sp. B21-028 TaxID=2895480 RepID=UPI00215ED902|nr:hypothetical protein [Pseudomonas sp. B21-028]UVL83861.1 hypothetical protein LOY35_27495 [Pseudomonas sp. B21-028]